MRGYIDGEQISIEHKAKCERQTLWSPVDQLFAYLRIVNKRLCTLCIPVTRVKPNSNEVSEAKKEGAESAPSSEEEEGRREKGRNND